jgi:hypothetical protein
MELIETEIRQSDLSGFTLFYQPTKKGWQMSTRRQSEAGWSVQIIPDADAQRLLSMIEPVSHVDGPRQVKPPNGSATDPTELLTVMQGSVAARSELTALIAARAGR